MEERLASHYDSLSRIIWSIRSTDTKAAPVLALHVALIGTLAARAEKLLAILAECPWGTEHYILVVNIAIYLILVIFVMGLAFLVYRPINPLTGDSLIYFEDIAATPFNRFREQAQQMHPEEIENQLLTQIHRVSRIASVKMRRVRWSIMLTIPTCILWAVLLAWGSA